MSNNTNPAAEAKEAMPAMKLEARVQPIAPDGNLIAFASVAINDCFVVDGIRLCTNDKGVYINMPGKMDDNGSWRDACKPITADFRKQLTDVVVEGYGIAVERMATTLEAAKAVQEKPSLTGALKDNAEKVRNQPPAEKAAGKQGQAL